MYWFYSFLSGLITFAISISILFFLIFSIPQLQKTIPKQSDIRIKPVNRGWLAILLVLKSTNLLVLSYLTLKVLKFSPSFFVLGCFFSLMILVCWVFFMVSYEA